MQETKLCLHHLYCMSISAQWDGADVLQCDATVHELPVDLAVEVAYELLTADTSLL